MSNHMEAGLEAVKSMGPNGIKIEQVISYRMIADIMVTAIESGYSSAWCEGVTNNTQRKGDAHKPWYDDEAYYAQEDFSFTIREDDEEGDNEVTDHVVGPNVMREALQAMANNSPSHFADLIGNKHDAETADVFLQYLALGEVYYG